MFKTWSVGQLATLKMGWEAEDGGRRSLELFNAANAPKPWGVREVRVGGHSTNLTKAAWKVKYHFATDGLHEYRFGGGYDVPPGSGVRTEFMFNYPLS